MSTIAQQIEELTSRMHEEDLDGPVHDAKGHEASLINNGGVHSQVAYLVAYCGQLETLSVLQGIIAKRYGGSDKAPGEAGDSTNEESKRGKKMTFRVTAQWAVTGTYEVEADSAEEAIVKIEADTVGHPLPSETVYVDGSWSILEQLTEEIEE